MLKCIFKYYRKFILYNFGQSLFVRNIYKIFTLHSREVVTASLNHTKSFLSAFLGSLANDRSYLFKSSKRQRNRKKKHKLKRIQLLVCQQRDFIQKGQKRAYVSRLRASPHRIMRRSRCCLCWLFILDSLISKSTEISLIGENTRFRVDKDVISCS